MTAKYLGNYFNYFQDQINYNKNIFSKCIPHHSYEYMYNNKYSDGNMLFAVGHNGFGELGFGHCEPVLKLTKHKLQNIKRIACSNNYNIFIDHHQNYFASGYNEYGQCGFNIKEKIIHLKAIQYTSTIEDFSSNIKNLKLCASISGNATFWIINDHKLYVNGSEQIKIHPYRQLRAIPSPKQIHNIHHPLDVAVAENYALLLCSINITSILHNWIRIHNVHNTPYDIINLMESFYGNTNFVFSASNIAGAGQNGRDNPKHFVKWTQIEALEHVNIIKIATGDDHSVFLDSNGTVWVCGRNETGQLGLGIGRKQCVYVPTEITYFVENNIRIKDVCCGAWHNLAIDYDDRVYAWGHNMHGQCGIGTTDNVFVPQRIFALEGLRIDNIQCGSIHSYCRTFDGKHFMFGSNADFECVKENEDEVDLPHLINDCVYEEIGAKCITDVYLCDRATFFIVNDGEFNLGNENEENEDHNEEDGDQNEEDEDQNEEDEDQNEDDWVFCHID